MCDLICGAFLNLQIVNKEGGNDTLIFETRNIPNGRLSRGACLSFMMYGVGFQFCFGFQPGLDVGAWDTWPQGPSGI